MKIKSVTRITEQQKVYDFTVDNVHHYVLDNGVISHNSYVPMKEMSGGGGLKYTADVIAFLSKKKDKDGTEVIGNIITIKLAKSRLTKENSSIEVKLNYRTGLDRYYGLLPIAVKYGIFTKLAKGYDIGGKRVYETQLDANPERYYTDDVLAKIDEACKKEFLYGVGDSSPIDLEIEEEDTDTQTEE